MDNLTEEKLSRLTGIIDGILSEKGTLLLAIDGPCGAGKTTLAQWLRQRYGCNVIHMDSFFLRPEQRTQERLEEPGGNVDYERFRDEVLLPLSGGKSFSYRPFSCSQQVLADPVAVTPTPLTVVEGTYALHPYFQEPYGLTVFLSIDPQTQWQRISQREAWKHELFRTRWIPMEQRYFSHFDIPGQCHILL